MNKIIASIKSNWNFLLCCLIVLLAISFSLKLMYFGMDFTFTFGDDQWNPYLSLADGAQLREFLRMHMFWMFINLFFIWMTSFSLLFLLNKVNKK